MTTQRNKDHIQTTHVGSLPRPHDLLDAMKERFSGGAYDEAGLQATLARSVCECVVHQKACGIDIAGDGEFSKPGFANYVQERLTGFEPRPGMEMKGFQKEVEAFPEYYEEYFKEAVIANSVVENVSFVCVGPVTYRGHEAVQRDIANVKAGGRAAGIPDEHLFMSASAPVGVAVKNEHYSSAEAFLHAVGEALNEEYKAITDAGLILQIDDPFLSQLFTFPGLDESKIRRRAEVSVDVINASLRGIPAEQVRIHTCYGINEGPRIFEASLADTLPYLLRMNVGAISFECANPRHEHEYHLFENIRIPDGIVLCPGCISHSSNIVEHPQLIAERIMRFANLVGRENVIASADCGFSSQALYKTEVHPTVVWEKFKALREGADIASKKLWP